MIDEDRPFNPKEDVVIKPKDLVYWEKAKDETIREIEKCENILKFQKAVLEMIEQKIKEVPAL